MTSVVGDTHALIWYLLDDPLLSVAAGDAFDQATAMGRRIYMPSICVVEAIYLAEKRRIPEHALLAFDNVVSDPDSPIRLIELTFEIARALREVSRKSVPDMPDRIIAATALALGLPLITRDAKIRASNIHTIW
ncbi:MAG: type II toxin-antitoxin system VapC family toxin [Bryobacteraceae bacterium]